MDYADHALGADDPLEALRLNRLALKHERRAADLLKEEWQEEPTRSILYRSAATLALDCVDYEEAERLVDKGSLGNPPPYVVDELMEVWQSALAKDSVQSEILGTGRRISKGSAPRERWFSGRQYVDRRAEGFLWLLGCRGERLDHAKQEVVKRFDREGLSVEQDRISFDAKILDWCRQEC
jgi:hypothetical protein